MLPQLLRLLTIRREFLDALVSETAVKNTLRIDPQVEIFGPGLWAVRHRSARRNNPKIRELSPPKLWTWRAITPYAPHALPPSDQAALAQLASSLHGLVLVQWRVREEGLSFVRWPVRAVKVGTRLTLQADAPKAEQMLSFVPLTGPDPYPLDRWAGVPFDAQVAALVEAIYIERVEVAELGAFTNVDVLAWRGDTRLSVEVKVRTRQAEADPADLARHRHTT